MQTQLLIFAALAAMAAAIGMWGILAVSTAGNDSRRMRQRLRSDLAQPQHPRASGLKELLTSLGERIAAPFMDDENGGVRDRLRADLVRAGIYSPNAFKLIVGARVTMLFAGLILGYAASLLLGYDWLLTLPTGGAIGYTLPRLWLSRRIRHNHLLLERGLPDGLDLLVVCVEAGLTIDAAIQRVSEELTLAHPALSRELSICHMETRVGLPRAQALRNLGLRTGFPPLQALTAMLVQADRFGTSIANALRIQAQSMRTQRRYRAEELAARATVKLSFPLVLFIFPATFIVLAGPMIINFMVNGFFGGD